MREHHLVSIIIIIYTAFFVFVIIITRCYYDYHRESASFLCYNSFLTSESAKRNESSFDVCSNGLLTFKNLCRKKNLMTDAEKASFDEAEEKRLDAHQLGLKYMVATVKFVCV